MFVHVLRAALFALVFLTPFRIFAAAPTATTSAATSITSSSAVLNGAGVPNSEQTTGWFRISSTNPGTCDDTFGTRVPASSGTDLGSGTGSVPYSINTTGLSPGVTYYFCSIVENASGKAYGLVLSFTVPAAPIVTTNPATSVTSTSATLQGSANPGAASTTGWYRYSTSDPGSCNDSFGTRAPSSGGSSLGSGTSPVTYTQGISSLLPGTTYYYCAIAQNSLGTSFGSVLSFTTNPNAPSVTTGSASMLTGSTATLNGTANPGGASTTGWFRYSTASPGTCNDSFGIRAPAAGGSALGSGNTSIGYSQPITGLTPLTVYYYCAIAQNSAGTSFGSVVSFTTPAVPLVTTNAASSINNTSAYLNGSANPRGAAATGYFRYSLTDPGTCNDSFGSRAPTSGGTSLGSGSSAIAFSEYLSGLSSGTTYYFCAIASNSEGTGFGAVLNFTTAGVPSATTSAATSVLATSATLNGSGNPKNDNAYGYYRYSTTNPGTCNDVFGTRAPASSGSDTYLGSGASDVSHSRAISGLTPTTTYYFCAITRNGYGTGFGSILSFTTPAAAPSVSTNSASSLTGTTATLNGSANPNGAATTGWFRYSTASPGTCNDSFGTRAPAAAGTSLGSGTTSSAYSQPITGLTAATTYYYCAIAQNSLGTSFGNIVTFTTPSAPTVTTSAASSIGNTTAYLNGSAIPNGSSATGYFRYATTNPGTCNDSFGSRAPASGGTSLGSSYSSIGFQEYITGLSAGTTYYFCAISANGEGTGFGSVLSFTTPAGPTVVTQAATSITAYSATLNATANPNGNTAYGYFRYSTTDPGTCNDVFGTRYPASSGSDTYLGFGASPVPYSWSLSGLTPATTYYFCGIGRNSYGTGFGAVLSFTTPTAIPVVQTASPSMLSSTSAQLNGNANPGGDATTGWFRYHTASPGTCNDSFGTRAPAAGGTALGSGVTTQAFSQSITGLLPSTTYFYCAIGQNSLGTAFGTVVSFTTPTVPTVTTNAASSITNTAVYLNGTANPNLAATTGYFRYSLTDPGTCNNSFGSRAPTAGGTSLGSGNSNQSFSEYISGLSQGTTYYFCAIATNSEGTAFGAVLSFTTATVPTMVTTAATSITTTSATLNGTGNPNSNTAYGYYRYSTTNPGSCNDVFGTRYPASSGSDTYLGFGTSPVAYNWSLSGLSPATTYYYCAIGRNGYGTGLGNVLSFTTLTSPPLVSTSSPTMLTGTTVTLNGSANPGGAATTGWFRYATSSPGTCNDSFGTRAPTMSGSMLGTGTSYAAYSQGVTGLTPATTYYYCAIAQNSLGTAFGNIVSFTTPTIPTVTTNAASSITSTTVYLNGSVNPNGASATAYHRYNTVDPGTCNDTFGTRTPASGGTAMGSGFSSSSYNQYVTGLSPGTTYYFCAIATNSEGTGFGAVLSFTTAGPPTVTTVAATSVTAYGATFNGNASPNGDYSYGYYRYGTTNPGTCSDAFGTRYPSSSSSDSYLGNGTSPVNYPWSSPTLTPGTTYYFCAAARNGYGTSFGAVLSFTTPIAAPVVSTASPTLLTGSSAQLNGTANPGAAATTGWFRYALASPGSCNDSFGTRTPMAGGTALGSGTTTQSFSQGITGLTPLTTYYYCAIAQNSVGISYGSVVSFTTPALPIVTTTAASSITNTAAYLNGTANPNLAPTTGYFRYSLTDPGTCNDSFGSRAPLSGGTSVGSGGSAVAFSEYLSGLSSGTTYYYCALATNVEGTAFGAVMSFKTAGVPTMVTSAPTGVTSTTATLNGSANPNNSTSYAYFRYSTTNPGTCNDVFGTRIPSSSGSDTYVGAGTVVQAYSWGISSLTPGTTYYYCAIGRNSYGNGFGSIVSFTTPAAAPSVTTLSASSLATTSATLNGSATPNGAATTAWFRYSTTSPGTCNDSFGTRAPGMSGTALGAGSSAQSFAEPITGLTPLTTYYYCAIAQNSVGTSFGALVTFTTTSAPSVSTLAATPVTATTATLNASVTANGYTTTGWFRYDTTNPGTCDTVFGTVTPTTNIGSGTMPVAMNQPLTGLSPATTYYFCAIAQSSIGTTLGDVLSFTTPAAPPSVTTMAATDIVADSATLNATANPNGSNTTGWFRYATSHPGTCNDSFGTRAPSAGGSGVGAGNSAVAFSVPISSLTSGTTYYFCAIASSGIGTSVGSVLSFTTAAAPSVTTSAATSITSTSATINGSGTPNVSATTGWFRYSTTNPGTCNDSFGTRTPASGGASLGSGSSAVPFSQALTGLTTGTTYYFCAIAENAVGKSFGAVLNFATLAVPTVTTVAASSVTSTGATLNGTANPNLLVSTGWFRYSTTNPGTCSDAFGTRAPASGGVALGAGGSAVPYAQSLTGLVAGTTYYYCAIASSSAGNGFGTVMSFTTAAAPTVTTLAATSVATTTATINGSANPNQLTATGWFRYATVSPGTCNDTFGTRMPSSGGTALGAGSADVPYSQALTGLTSGVTYYYCAIASNSQGTRFGAVLSFTTQAAPTVTTLAATSVTSTDATLEGSANPNGTASTGWFRYSTTNPGTCTDAFGIRTPAAGGTSLGSGTSAVAFSQPLSGLTSGTTYYYCAIASSAIGTGFGTVQSFVTLAAPTVTTQAATAVTGSGATLNASGNPNAAATTGWFRYDTTDPGTCDDSFGTRAPASGGTALGSGTSAVAFSQTLSGLAAATTYYYCAIGSNSVGTSYGAVMSFATTAAPTVTTTAATAVTSTAATLNGSGNPNNLAATGWFRYSTTNPGTCNDSFGTRAPGSGGTSLGAGSSAVAYSQALSGLTSGTTYYYCALASNSVGTGVGTVLSFTTPGAPTVTTNAATAITSTDATLNGTASPNLSATTGWFRYSTTNPGTCNDAFGTRAPAASGASLGSGSSPVAYSQAVTGLTSGTTYYFCAIAQNAAGTRFGAVLSFTTLALPSVTTDPATAVTSTGATLNGTANPNGTASTGWFRYSTTNPGTCNDSFGTRAPASGGTSLGAGSMGVAYSEAITGLAAGTTYYFCALADNAVGTNVGAVLSFTTPNGPSVTTLAATSVVSTSATLNGSGNPNLSATTGWFRYSTTNPGTCNDAFGTRAPTAGGASLGSGSSATPYSQTLAGLTSATTYYFCAIAQNAVGTSFGAVLSFTTTSVPGVTTLAATSVTSTGATINGSANPNNLAASGWFRYSTTNPGTCNDSFGTRAPTAGSTSLGAGSSAVAYSQSLTGLTTATTYYYCAIASNSVGTGFGTVLSFTTTAAPVVTTNAASAITSTDATINGTANPNLAATTGWFRYSTVDPGACTDAFGTRAPAAGGTALGSGQSGVAYSEPLAGLMPGTTYYFCAIASNAVGIQFGAVLSFTTTAAPSVTTNAATMVASTSATLNGAANPNSSATSAWFRYSATNPGSCNDSFGTKTPATGVALGAGSTSVPFSDALTGLSAGTTYYFCAIAESAVGTSFGAVLSFSTPISPSVTTNAASSVTSVSATLNGAANPNQQATTGWYRYSATNPGTCNDSFGTRAPTVGGTALGSGSSSVAFSRAITGLAPATTYYYCAIAQNVAGTSFGSVLTFTTTAAPAVTTQVATAISGTGATVNGSAIPNGSSATGWFRYSTTNPGTCNDVFGTRAPTAGGTSIGSGSVAVPYARNLTGLTSGATYYYCAIASNAVGISYGAVMSFTTMAKPAVTTDPASNVVADSAQLNGTANPNGDASTGWFRYDTTNPGTCDDTFGTRAPSSGGFALGAGDIPEAYSEVVTGLMSGTTYYYCAIAENSSGTAFGLVLSFTTPGAPAVVTAAATAVDATTATLNGSANPNMLEATGWFRYSATNPGTCDENFGTRAPAAGGTALGNGTTSVPFTENLTGLTPGTKYYYCALASNAAGVGLGTVMSFTTPKAPTVTTDPASMVLGTSATLNGTVTANQLDTTSWFRFSTTDPGTCNDSFGTREPLMGGTSIGNGTTAVAYSNIVTGLLPTTTYYFCAIAENSVGKAYGSVLSFTTTDSPPTVTTEAATNAATIAATLNGTANANLLATTAWFRFDTTDPGTCDDTFGTRAPAMNGTAIGSGGTVVAYSEPLTGLLPATTYYFCAVAENSAGKAFGDVLSFTTEADPPTVVTSPPTNVQSMSAELNGSANPNGTDAIGWFRYDTTDPGTCDDTFGTRVPAADGTMLGKGLDPVAFTETLTGLTTGTTYYYCAIASNPQGTTFGEVVAFQPGAVAPVVTTEATTDITGFTATIAGTANPNGTDATGWFRLGDVDPGTDTCDDSYGTRVPMMGGTMLGSGVDPVPFTEALVDLEPNKTYYYCAAASNLGGAAFGSFLSFTTEAVPPEVKTVSATVAAMGGDVVLDGTANPQGSETIGWFRFDTTDPGACNDTFGTRAPAMDGTALGAERMDVPYKENLTKLAPGTYFYCAIASNDAGTAFGEVLTFEVKESEQPIPTPPPTDGCGCRTVSSSQSDSGLIIVAGLALLALRRRPRKAA